MPKNDGEESIPEGPLLEMWKHAKARGMTYDRFEYLAAKAFNEFCEEERNKKDAQQ